MLSPQQVRTLHRALRQAFTREEFESLLTLRLNLSLDRLVVPTAPADVWASEVLQLAERRLDERACARRL